MKKRLFCFLLITLSSCALLNPNPNRDVTTSHPVLELRPFTTDYCSDFPEGNFSNPNQWKSCCFVHDLHYWIGGTETERKNSDLELQQCVKNSGSSVDAFLMYIGVRMGGEPGEASYSWGYGWTIKRDYQKIYPRDIQHAVKLLESSKYNNKETLKFIKDVLEKRI